MNLDEQVVAFRKHLDLQSLIGISGGAKEYSLAETIRVARVVDEAVGVFARKHIGLVTSGTKQGIPCHTMSCAFDNVVPVVRIFPARGQKHLTPHTLIKLDLEIEPRCGASEWGDESEVFVKVADAFLFIGGGAGTLVEIAHWAKMNQTRADHSIPPIPAVPVMGFGGVSEWLVREGATHFPSFFTNATPPEAIQSGHEAALWLVARLANGSGGQ